MGQQQSEALERSSTAVALTREDLIGSVTRRIEALTKGQELRVPENYAIGNAIAAWWLALQKPIDSGKNEGKIPLDLATDESVIQATLDMVVLGLDPAKEQCYPIVYGARVACRPSYFGRVKLLKDVYPDAEPCPQVVYEGDPFERAFQHGRLIISKHEPGPNNGVDGKEIGAYVYIHLGEDLEPLVEWMPIAQIKKAWQQGGAKGNSPAHKNFPGEMCKKTVIGRGAKVAVKSSDHSYLVGIVDRQDMMAAEDAIGAEIADEANGPVIDITDDPPALDAAPDNVDPEPPGDPNVDHDPDPDGAGESDYPEPGTDEDEPLAGSPADQFNALIDAHQLNATLARRIAAQDVGLTDARRLTHAHFERILSDPDRFLALYTGAARNAEPATGSSDKGADPDLPGF